MEGGVLKLAFLIVGGIGIAMMLLLAAGLVYYIRISLKRRAALGLGWDFDRDEQPILFWLQIAVAGWGVFLIVGNVAAAVIKLPQIL